MLKRINIVILAFITLTSAAMAQQKAQNENTPVSDKLIDHIVGTWRISQVINTQEKVNDKSRDVKSQKEKSQGLVLLEFKREGRYRTMDDQNMIDSGSYRLNENHNKIYFESDANHANPSEWEVSILNNLLTIQPVNNARFKYAYKLDEEDKQP